VCENVDIGTHEQRMYFDWLIEHFGIGNVKETCTRMFFPNQIGKKKKLIKFEADMLFPVPQGQLWDQHRSRYLQNTDGTHVASAADYSESSADAIVAELNRKSQELAQMAHRDYKDRQCGDLEYDRLCSYVELEAEVRRDLLTSDYGCDPDYVCWNSVETKSRQDQPPVDERGIPIAPKSMKELETWGDTQVWDDAINKEWDGLNDRGCFEHDLTRAELRKRGIHKKVIGMRMLLESKVVNGEWSKAKARNVAQGHKGNLTKGVDYTTVFAAAPDLATGRIIQGLVVLFGFVRCTLDIMQAYLIGKAEEDQQYPVRYPEGRIREEHRDPNTGEERYALLIGNLYGMPTASRVFSKERDRLLLEELPKRHPGVTVSQMEFEPCMFKLKRKGVGFISIHVDDADGCFEYAEDAKFWTECTNDLFRTEKQPGIKVVDPEHMLGVTRVLSEKDGIRYMTLTQAAYIEGVWQEYGHHRKGKRKPSTPMPGKGDNCPPPLDENEKPVGVTDKEAREVQALGYRKLIGECLWPMRNTCPGVAAGMSMLSKCVHRPSMGAWLAALHLLHFLYVHKDEGIQFRSDGNTTPVCFYDSAFYQDLIGHKPLYGYVIFWAGGPLMWRSKKHTNIPLHTSEAEYMTITHAFRAVKWLKSLLTEMGFGWMVAKPIEMFGDNRNATDWAVEKMITDGNRHIDICYMKIRERVRRGDILPVWIHGKNNPSDILTKPVEKDVIDRLLSQLNGLEPIEGLTVTEIVETFRVDEVNALIAEIYDEVCDGMKWERTRQVKL
jgi:hypothetical protein